MIHPSSPRLLDNRASISSPTRSVDAAAEKTQLLAKYEAEYKDKTPLLAEAGRLLPQQAPPGPSPVLIAKLMSRWQVQNLNKNNLILQVDKRVLAKSNTCTDGRTKLAYRGRLNSINNSLR